MPTYSYVCDACGHQFEQFQAMTDEPTKRCPSCRKKRVRRLIGAGAGLIFKGSGFYLTDYGRKTTPPGKSPAAGEDKSKVEQPGASQEKLSGEKESNSTGRNSDK